MGSVLIVDDDDSFATAAGRIVQELGHTSQRAADGQEGLAKFHDGDFDVVIADLKIPRMGGIEFIREVKKIDRDAVVMVITGFAALSTAVETRALGAYDYVEKPVEPAFPLLEGQTCRKFALLISSNRNFKKSVA